MVVFEGVTYCCGGANKVAILCGFSLAIAIVLLTGLAMTSPIATNDQFEVDLWRTCLKKDGCEQIAKEQAANQTGRDGLYEDLSDQVQSQDKTRRDAVDENDETDFHKHTCACIAHWDGNSTMFDLRKTLPELLSLTWAASWNAEDIDIEISPETVTWFTVLFTMMVLVIAAHAFCALWQTVMCIQCCCTMTEKWGNLFLVLVAVLSGLCTAFTLCFASGSLPPKEEMKDASFGMCFWFLVAAAALSLCQLIVALYSCLSFGIGTKKS
jgi:hypothetical protein